MIVEINGSKKERGGIKVFFGNENTSDFYYTHSIASIGEQEDEPSRMNTAWSWINHLRSKRWWNPILERDFLFEIRKHL